MLLACQARDAREPRARGGQATIEAVAPKGTVSFPFAFQWRHAGGGSDAIFRLTVYDEVERQVLERETRGSQLPTTPDLQALFSPTRRFLWRVAVVDGTGNVLAQTELVECTVK